MIEKSDIENFVRQVYSHVSVYDYGDYLRVTNGSAAMYGDIRIENGTLRIKGERYQRTFNTEHEATYDGLKMALRNLGL